MPGEPSTAMQSGGPAAHHIVLYGSSLTAARCWRFWRRCGGHWTRELGPALREKIGVEPRISNVALWGSDSSWSLRRLDARVLARRPTLLLFEFSINDADRRRGISLSRSRHNLEGLIDRVGRELPDCRLLPMTMSPVWGPPAELRPELARYYEIYREVALERSLELIDLYERWTALDLAALRGHLPDGVHPDAAACTSVVLPAVVERLSALLLA